MGLLDMDSDPAGRRGGGLLGGLLGSSIDDPRTTATLQLAQGLLGAPRAMQGLSSGLLGYTQSMQQSRQQQAVEEMRKMQMQQMALQYQQALKSQQQSDLDRALTQKAFSPVRPIEANEASGIAGPRPAALGVVGQQPQFDPRQFVSSGGSLQGAAGAAQLLAKQQPKLSKLEPMRGPDGQLVNVAVFEDGTTKVLPYGVRPEMVFQDLGGRVAAIDKNAVPSGMTFGKSQTPDGAASNAVAWANVGNARDRLAFDKTQARSAVTYQQDADGNFVALPTHTDGGAVRAAAVAAPGGGLQPLQGKGAGMTEDQAKATGWLVQADNAWKNMRAVMQNNPGAMTPGPGDGIAVIPGLSGAGNFLRSADRQKFIQAASSLSEAMLRAATGAGVNRDEAAQKVAELTPQFGDSKAVVDQKMASIPRYIASLQVRAGPGARKAAAIDGGAPSSSDPLGLRSLLGGGGDPTDPLGLRR